MRVRRFSAAALALVVVLAVSPVATAVPPGERDISVRERIVRLIAKIQKIFNVSTNNDVPNPPLP